MIKYNVTYANRYYENLDRETVYCGDSELDAMSYFNSEVEDLKSGAADNYYKPDLPADEAIIELEKINEDTGNSETLSIFSL